MEGYNVIYLCYTFILVALSVQFAAFQFVVPMQRNKTRLPRCTKKFSSTGIVPCHKELHFNFWKYERLHSLCSTLVSSILLYPFQILREWDLSKLVLHAWLNTSCFGSFHLRHSFIYLFLWCNTWKRCILNLLSEFFD